MATHSSILASRIPWTEDPGELRSIGSQRVKLNWVTSISPAPELQCRVCCCVYTPLKRTMLWAMFWGKHVRCEGVHPERTWVLVPDTWQVEFWQPVSPHLPGSHFFCSSLKKIKQHLMPLSFYKNSKETWDKRWLRSIVFFFKVETFSLQSISIK